MSGLESNGADQDLGHVEWDEFAVGWALRALEPDDESRFAAHMSVCPRCQATISDSSHVLTEVLNQMPLQSPSPHLRARLLAEADRTRPLSADEPMESASEHSTDSGGSLIDFAAPRHRSSSSRRQSSWAAARTLLVAAAAVLVIAGLGIWNLNLQSDRNAAASIAADRAEILQDLAAAGDVQMTPLVDEDGDAVAYLVMGTSRAMVMTDGLGVNEDATTYVLWGLQDAGQAPLALGTFDVLHNELDMRTVGSTVAGIDSFNGYALTLEPGDAAPATPTLPVVASGQVSN